MVGLAGLEPATSRLSGVRSNHLSYRPVLIKKNGRGGETRTPGPMVPNHVRYQTALHLEIYKYNMKDGRGGETRTPGPMVPNHVRYQTALHLDFC